MGHKSALATRRTGVVKVMPAERRAVVCDGDPFSSRLLGRQLEAQGFTVIFCETAACCDGALAKGRVDLLVLEVLLSDVDGLAYTRQLRARGVKAPILIVSALHAEQRAREAGADGFFLKPVQPSTFATTIARLRTIQPGAA